MKLFFSIILIILSIAAQSQQFVLETALDASVSETSGIIILNNTLITHNDSGNTNQLFEIDTSTGNISRTVTITNATNVDWEDITMDDTYIYIGDFGNNYGTRTDLKIYRIAITDYLASTSVTADIINFSYSNQNSFFPNPFNTNFDAESLIHYNNALYVFSKNWDDNNTNIYQISKSPGTHSVNMVDTINAQGLVTGATYNASANEVMLSGYDADGAFLIQLDGFHSGLFSNGNISKTTIDAPSNYSPQIEAIVPFSATEYYITAESSNALSQGLYSINTSTLNNNEVDAIEFSFSPNPASKTITLSHYNLKVRIYDITGKLVKTTTEKRIDISKFNTGVYLVKIEDLNSDRVSTKRLMVL